MNAATKRQSVLVFAWATTVIPTLIAIYRWGNDNGWSLGTSWPYQLFPLFGLLAFSIMWGHYMASAVRQLASEPKSTLSSYFTVTSWAVLALILAHPGLLITKLYLNGQGLPPFSYIHYVGPMSELWVLLGTTAFFLFLAYELHRWYQDKPWWWVIGAASDIGMIFILLHSLNLGSQLMSGWFRDLWFFYGVTLIASLVYTYWLKLAGPKQ